MAFRPRFQLSPNELVYHRINMRIGDLYALVGVQLRAIPPGHPFFSELAEWSNRLGRISDQASERLQKRQPMDDLERSLERAGHRLQALGAQIGIKPAAPRFKTPPYCEPGMA